jgi:hypothetical protein
LRFVSLKIDRIVEKFFDFWIALRKDANPGIPEVEDARKKLAGLKSN